MSSPYVTVFPLNLVDTTPFDTVMLSTGAPSFFEAIASSACRASAAAVRIAGEPRAIDELEYVPP